ncbi:hypothetical protein [Tsukamurella pseudospumae]|uniref:hypothetical protein n=1 Tax=Tsukamurella pseudospumae TaxID=239498 RepID=UPI001112C7C8|nr:hypothetical protein [Tsukamurella pseudospumae]
MNTRAVLGACLVVATFLFVPVCVLVLDAPTPWWQLITAAAVSLYGAWLVQTSGGEDGEKA